MTPRGLRRRPNWPEPWHLVAITGVVAGIACGQPADRRLELAKARQLLRLSTVFRNGSSPSRAYAGASETTIRSASPDENFGARGLCEADGADGAGGQAACLLRWDLSAIPEDASVEAARITLEIVGGSSDTYDLYALERVFDAARATWNTASGSESWHTPGALGDADRGPLIGSVSGEPGSQTIELDAEGLRRVQSWVRGDPNHGVLIARGENADGIDVASSEASIVAHRPALEVTYRAFMVPPAAEDGASLEDDDGFVFTSGGGAEPEADRAARQGVLIAFIGDQGSTDNSSAVLELIAREGADAVVHNGDFDYVEQPDAWDARVSGVLGEDYPYFAIVGNHDAPAWYGPGGYAEKIAARHARVPEMDCTGELGVRAVCRFRGVHLVQSCIGTDELRPDCAVDSSDQLAFIREALRADDSPFSICNWHKNQHDIQVGIKTDEVGWEAYRECMRAGAIIATGHEHSYSRTLTLTEFGNAAAGHGPIGVPELMELGRGRTFAFVSGLAGYGIRNFAAADHDDDTWWASYYAGNRWLQNGVLMPGAASYGALFIEFGAGGDPRRARAYFKDVSGRIADEFTILAP